MRSCPGHLTDSARCFKFEFAGQALRRRSCSWHAFAIPAPRSYVLTLKIKRRRFSAILGAALTEDAEVRRADLLEVENNYPNVAAAIVILGSACKYARP
jgi:hypothetical protein